MTTVLVTGGAGYVGAVLTPKLLDKGYRVKVLDLFFYGEDVLDGVRQHPRLSVVKGDIRDQRLLKQELQGVDAVIHLACISNDPSYELNPVLGKSINYDAFAPLVRMAKTAGVRRFVYASSSSVYGIKKEENVTEDLPLEPLTDYSRYKAMCEDILLKEQSPEFTTLVLRPATLCGYSPRQRLDLTVNILTNHAVNRGEITVFGGSQKRPNLHIEDMTDLYLRVLDVPSDQIAGKIFNVGYENYSVLAIAEIVKKALERPDIRIITQPSDDGRSYHIASRKIERELGFVPRHTIEEAVKDLKAAFEQGRIPRPLEDDRYYNIRTMQAVALSQRQS